MVLDPGDASLMMITVSSPPPAMALKVRHIYVSPGHNYFGHHGKPAGSHPSIEVERAECVAGQGLRGDRFFGFKEGYKGQITLFSWEVFQALKAELDAPRADVRALRRNVVTAGVDLNDLIGQRFDIQGVQLQGMEECRPCYWMDQAIAPGANEWLKGRGGLRCRILTDGVIHAGA
jgi:MOSC domain-containing protein YiiM